MPEMRFKVRWPDETESTCYSPSLVVKDFLAEGQSYELDDFMDRCRQALTIASERVREKYGFYCTGASAQLAELERTAENLRNAKSGSNVTVLQFQ